MNNAKRGFVGAVAAGFVAVPLGSLLNSLQAAGMAKLSPDDPTAKSLNYSHQSADTNKICAGCQFYSDPASAEWGPCVIFPEKLVSANGVCNSWLKRAG
jgi:hypothetical protein